MGEYLVGGGLNRRFLFLFRCQEASIPSLFQLLTMLAVWFVKSNIIVLCSLVADPSDPSKDMSTDESIYATSEDRGEVTSTWVLLGQRVSLN